ncbi:MAG: nitroreductase family protein [Desulfobulbus sp.]|jgi:nitroreductase|nr:nitroreductase family protein [Desulfobulbus sp.]
MNPKLVALFARRSIRAYTDRPVPDTLLTDLLKAGMAAPSAVAKDPWHFIVLRSRVSLDQLASVLPNGQMLGQAPLALVVCGDLDRAHDRELSFLLQDVSAAVENILIAASILGLGACWLGIHPRPGRIAAVAAQLDLPSQVLPVAGIALGWPAQQRAARTRYNPACVHQEQW